MAEEEKPLIQELSRFTLWTKNPSTAEGARQCKLAFAIRDNCPRITVFTHDPADTERFGMISAPMDPETFFIFLSRFEEICRGPNGMKDHVSNYTRMKDSAGKFGDIIKISDVIFGKDAEGMCWISVITENRPKIKFEYKLSNYHRIYDKEGNEVVASEGSKCQALATIDLLRRIIADKCSGYRVKKPYVDRKNAPGVPESKKATSMSFDDDVTF